MSDDCRYNIETITEAMQELKTSNPQISFFVIETAGGKFIKRELAPMSNKSTVKAHQLELSMDSSTI